ncbi:MAG: autotransporter-associated beta strand repeat-containing protein [Verrucomicrobiota bacterium]
MKSVPLSRIVASLLLGLGIGLSHSLAVVSIVANSEGNGGKTVTTSSGGSLSSGSTTVLLGTFTNPVANDAVIRGDDYAAMIALFTEFGDGNATAGSGAGGYTVDGSGEFSGIVSGIDASVSGFAPSGTDVYMLIVDDDGIGDVDQWAVFRDATWEVPADSLPFLDTFFTSDIDSQSELLRGNDNGGSLSLEVGFSSLNEIWDGGGGDDLWGTGANWLDDGAPAQGSIIHFAGSTRTTPDFNYGSFDQMAQIYFDDGAASFTLGGNSIKLQTNGSADPLIQNDSTSTQTVEFANIAWNDSGVIFANDGDIVLSLDGGAAPGSGALFLDNGSNLTLRTGSGRTITVNNSIQNAGGSVTVEGSGTVVLNNSANNYDGATTIDSGTLQLGVSEVINDASSVSVDGGTLDLAGQSETVSSLTLSSGAVTDSSQGANTITSLSNFSAEDGTISANLAGGVALQKTTSGTVTIEGSSTSYTGNTEIDEGTLQVGEGGSLPGSSAVFLGNGGTTGTAASFLISDADGGTTISNDINVNPGDGTNRTVGGTNTSGTNTFSGTINMDGSFGENRSTTVTAAGGGTVHLSGAIEGAGQNLVKTGAGTVEISNNANTYSGSTSVNEGTLLVTGSLGSTSSVTVNSGGTLAGGGSIGGPATLVGSGNLDPIGTLNFTDSLDIAGSVTGSRLLFDLSSDQVALSSGVLSIGIGLVDFSDFVLQNALVFSTYTLFSTNNPISGAFGPTLSGTTANGVFGTLSLADGGTDLIFSTAPEVSTGLPLLAVLLFAVLRQRRRCNH